MRSRSLPLTLVLTVVVTTLAPAACRKSATEPGLNGGGPEVVDPASALAEPGGAVEPRSVGSRLMPTLPVQTLVQTYRCWFERPYEYMFDGGGRTVDLGSGPHGRLMAGIGGIMNYGSLTRCLGEQIDVEQRSYSTLEPIAALAGMPVWSARPGPHGFGYLNPEIIRWGEQALVIDPRTELAPGLSAGEVYEVVFARFFRLSAHAYADLRSGDYARQVADYLAAVDGGEDGIDYLEARFGGRLSEYGGYADGTQMTSAMAYGFWLRRRADGTSEALWASLRRLLLRYDAAWMANLDARYGPMIR